MLHLHVALAALTAAVFLHPAGSGDPAGLAVGTINLDESVWGRGSQPTITFSVTAGRGQPEKVAAFLYVSELPNAFDTSPWQPQFVGVLTVPSTITVVVDRTPERGPINAFSREKFVQGALFDSQTGALVDVTNEEYIDIAYDAPPTEYTLKFDFEDDFTTPLVNGQGVRTPPIFGELVSLSTLPPAVGNNHHGAVIFDTDPQGPNANSSDPDLLVGLGNALCLQENPGQLVPGIFDQPDDARDGGSIVIEFTGFDIIEKVEPVAIDLIDCDGAGGGMQVAMTDVLGHQRVFSAPPGWTEDIAVDGPPGYRTLDLTSLVPQAGFMAPTSVTSSPDFIPGEVVRMEIILLGSGAIDNVMFRREADPGALKTGSGARSSNGPTGPVKLR